MNQLGMHRTFPLSILLVVASLNLCTLPEAFLLPACSDDDQYLSALSARHLQEALRGLGKLHPSLRCNRGEYSNLDTPRLCFGIVRETLQRRGESHRFELHKR